MKYSIGDATTAVSRSTTGVTMGGINSRALCLLACLVAGAICAGNALAEEKLITWVIPEYPPIYIADGPLAGQGEGDRILQWFRDALPDYEHKVLQHSVARTMGMLANPNINVCNPGMVALPHLDGPLLIGEQITALLPLRAITYGEPGERFVFRHDTLRLTDTLANGVVVGLVAGRHYSDLQPLLDQYAESGNLLYLSQDNTLDSLYRMLVAGRVDMLIDYGFLLPFFRALEPDSEVADGVRMRVISEASQTMTVHPMCRNNPWGRRVIDQLNQQITSPAFRAMMKENRRRHLPPEEWAEHDALLNP